jgi:tRNA G18 (ribose-2'-O)-methylase SpoU
MMTLIRIDDLSDERLNPYRSLKQTNETSRRGLFIAEGDKLVRRLLESRLTVESVLLSEPYVAAFESLLPYDIPALVIPDHLVEGLVGYNFHRGILACGRRPSADFGSLTELLGSPGAHCTVVVCHDVQDPENLGAILRMSAGFGVDAVILGPRCADPFSRRVQRVSMGNVYRLVPIHIGVFPEVFMFLREMHGVESWATVLDADATPLAKLKRPRRLALVFGSEGHGLTDDVVAACDRKVTIPMRPGVDSLNVAVAAGIFLYSVLGTQY